MQKWGQMTDASMSIHKHTFRNRSAALRGEQNQCVQTSAPLDGVLRVDELGLLRIFLSALSKSKVGSQSGQEPNVQVLETND